MNILHKTSIAAMSFSNKSLIFSALAVSLAGTYTAPASAQQVSSINVSGKDTVTDILYQAWVSGKKAEVNLRYLPVHAHYPAPSPSASF